MRIPIDRLLIAIALFVASSTFIYFLVTLGDDSGEPVLNLPAAAAPTSTPVVAAIPTVVVPPAPAPEATAVRPLVITPSPTPEPSAAELEERDVLAPWVYYFPTKWVPDAAEWPEAYRWQDPLPTIEPPLDWKYDTYRTPYPTFGGGYRDRPFIVGINADEPFGLFPGSLMGALETLTPQLDRDMRAIFKTHHEIIPLWAQAIATLDTREVAPLIAQQAPVVLAQVTGELRDAGVGAQALAARARDHRDGDRGRPRRGVAGLPQRGRNVLRHRHRTRRIRRSARRLSPQRSYLVHVRAVAAHRRALD